MSVLLAMVAATSTVPTHPDHFSVAATMASLSPATEGPVWTMTSALLTPMIVAKYVPTQPDRLVVAVTVASHWPPMEGPAWR